MASGDLAIMEDPLFKRISVTAYKWLAVNEVKPDVAVLGAYLRGLKEQGYLVNLVSSLFPQLLLCISGSRPGTCYCRTTLLPTIG